MRGLGGVVAGLGFGLGSAIVPLLNAEAYLVATISTNPWLVVPLVLAVAMGQTAGELLIFEAARRGSSHLVLGRTLTSQKLAAASTTLKVALADRRSGVPIVFVAATVGLPPLALVSVASGSAHQSRLVFALTCLVGRTLRFGALAIPVLAVVSN